MTINNFSRTEAHLFCVLWNKAAMSRVYSSLGFLPLKRGAEIHRAEWPFMAQWARKTKEGTSHA